MTLLRSFYFLAGAIYLPFRAEVTLAFQLVADMKGRPTLASLQSKADPLSKLRTIGSSSISNLCKFSKVNGPQIAKDEAYAKAVLEAWQQDVSGNKKHIDTVGSPLTYSREDGTDFYGYLVSSTEMKKENDLKGKLPGVLMFHTGAGPQDIFLRWKADTLVNELGCVVLIVDIISDSEGYAWSDRERYAAARTDVLEVTGERGERRKLRETIHAALTALKAIDEVDENSIAALGWCMGGHPILELGLMQESSVKALISYHGVFDGIRQNKIMTREQAENGHHDCTVLICNGKQDPFVEYADVENTQKLFEDCGYNVKVMNFDGVRHGFTNPAQDFNLSDAFSFDKDAATESWEATVKLLQSVLFK